MPIAAWLLSMVGGIVGRVLLALGFSVVSMVGFEVAVGTLKNSVISSSMSLPGDVLSLFLLAGGGMAMNIIFAAITFRVSIWAIQRSTRLLGVSA